MDSKLLVDLGKLKEKNRLNIRQISRGRSLRKGLIFEGYIP
jgi:hypothetical protein